MVLLNETVRAFALSNSTRRCLRSQGDLPAEPDLAPGFGPDDMLALAKVELERESVQRFRFMLRSN